MASPQLENGYTRIAHEILEALCKVNLSPYESRGVLFILRETYGRHRKTVSFTLSAFSKYLGLDRRLVHRALKSLSMRQIIVISRDDKNRITYKFQKDHSKWKLSSAEMTSSVEMTNRHRQRRQRAVVSIYERKKISNERVVKDKRSVRKTDPRVKEFIDWFVAEYQTRFAQRYHVNGGKDGRTIQGLLRDFDLTELKERTAVLFETNDRFISKTDRGIGILKLKINDLGLWKASAADLGQQSGGFVG